MAAWYAASLTLLPAAVFVIVLVILYSCATRDPYTASNPRTFDKVYGTKPF
jgi:hypothetical protein